MATDYGEDISGLGDLDPDLAPVSGPMAVAQNIARALVTPLGGLWYDETYGYDIRQFLNAPLRSASEIAFHVEAEAMKDERVEAANARVVLVGRKLHVLLILQLAEGTFRLVLTVDTLTLNALVEPVI